MANLHGRQSFADRWNVSVSKADIIARPLSAAHRPSYNNRPDTDHCRPVETKMNRQGRGLQCIDVLSKYRT